MSIISLNLADVLTTLLSVSPCVFITRYLCGGDPEGIWTMGVSLSGFVGFMYQLNTYTYLTDQCITQYVVILTLCCNEQALLTLDINVVFIVKIEFLF